MGSLDDIHLILADPDGLNYHHIHAKTIQDQSHIGGRARKTTQCPPGGQTADKDPLVSSMTAHADTVAKDGATGKGTGGVYGNHTDFLAPLAEGIGQLVHQRGLAGAGRAGDADDIGITGTGE